MQVIEGFVLVKGNNVYQFARNEVVLFVIHQMRLKSNGTTIILGYDTAATEIFETTNGFIMSHYM